MDDLLGYKFSELIGEQFGKLLSDQQDYEKTRKIIGKWWDEHSYGSPLEREQVRVYSDRIRMVAEALSQQVRILSVSRTPFS